MNENTIILSWLILGLINVTLLYIAQKKRPGQIYQHLNKGFLHQTGVLILWYIFGFIIIPFMVLNMLRKTMINKLLKVNKKLQETLNNLQNQAKK